MGKRGCGQRPSNAGSHCLLLSRARNSASVGALRQKALTLPAAAPTFHSKVYSDLPEHTVMERLGQLDAMVAHTGWPDIFGPAIVTPSRYTFPASAAGSPSEALIASLPSVAGPSTSLSNPCSPSAMKFFPGQGHTTIASDDNKTLAAQPSVIILPAGEGQSLGQDRLSASQETGTDGVSVNSPGNGMDDPPGEPISGAPMEDEPQSGLADLKVEGGKANASPLKPKDDWRTPAHTAAAPSEPMQALQRKNGGAGLTSAVLIILPLLLSGGLLFCLQKPSTGIPTSLEPYTSVSSITSVSVATTGSYLIHLQNSAWMHATDAWAVGAAWSVLVSNPLRQPGEARWYSAYAALRDDDGVEALDLHAQDWATQAPFTAIQTLASGANHSLRPVSNAAVLNEQKRARGSTEETGFPIALASQAALQIAESLPSQYLEESGSLIPQASQCALQQAMSCHNQDMEETDLLILLATDDNLEKEGAIQVINAGEAEGLASLGEIENNWLRTQQGPGSWWWFHATLVMCNIMWTALLAGYSFDALRRAPARQPAPCRQSVQRLAAPQQQKHKKKGSKHGKVKKKKGSKRGHKQGRKTAAQTSGSVPGPLPSPHQGHPRCLFTAAALIILALLLLGALLMCLTRPATLIPSSLKPGGALASGLVDLSLAGQTLVSQTWAGSVNGIRVITARLEDLCSPKIMRICASFSGLPKQVHSIAAGATAFMRKANEHCAAGLGDLVSGAREFWPIRPIGDLPPLPGLRVLQLLLQRMGTPLDPSPVSPTPLSSDSLGLLERGYVPVASEAALRRAEELQMLYLVEPGYYTSLTSHAVVQRAQFLQDLYVKEAYAGVLCHKWRGMRWPTQLWHAKHWIVFIIVVACWPMWGNRHVHQPPIYHRSRLTTWSNTLPLAPAAAGAASNY